jgi:hypothetical protein
LYFPAAYDSGGVYVINISDVIKLILYEKIKKINFLGFPLIKPQTIFDSLYYFLNKFLLL